MCCTGPPWRPMPFSPAAARVGLVTTKGYRQILQIARSFVPGALTGWVLYNKSIPLAPLELTSEVPERIGARGEVVEPLDEGATRQALRRLKNRRIEALTISLINAYANGVHEQRIRELASEEIPGVPISLSSEVIPEMLEYERTITTVANSYVRPVMERYVRNLRAELSRSMAEVKLHILRSDGGLASAEAALNIR
jgi:N-methylhydantoinase A